ncbi:PadR family transcriptional regulator [Curtobacterium sp. L1-20]|uniref:PadR family transcriptional regulator n=1 Tax=Curtobacterium sp. L1-20 TaxID=3138181 RepID=UPI003B5173FB
MTASTIDVLSALLDHDGPAWGLLVIKATGRPAGTVYPILERLEQRGWIASSWEDDDARPGPRRRMYEYTPDGRAAALDARAAFRRRAPQRRPSGRVVTP